MLLWVVLAVMTAAVLIVLLRPFIRPARPEPARASHDLAVFRDQLTELDRDIERGVMSAADAGAARTEIERRLLALGPRDDIPEAAPATSRTGRIAAASVALFVPVAALSIYLTLGSPDKPDEPLAARTAERPLLTADGTLDIEKARGALEARLAKEPDSVEGWLLLGRTDGVLSRWPDAKAAYDKALQLSGRRADVLQDYGELLIAEADGTVTPAAKALFEEALKQQPGAPTARYSLALARAQDGDIPGAVAEWQALAHDAPADAPWLPTLHAAIAAGQRELAGGNLAPEALADKPPAEVGAIMQLPESERLDAIRGMAAGLAAKLEQNPDDLAGWKRLGRSYLVLRQPKDAADAYAKALRQAPRDPELVLGRAQALRAEAGDSVALTPDTIAAYRQVIEVTPNQPEAMWYLGLAAKQRGDDSDARQTWQRLLDQLGNDNPQSAEIKRQLGSLKAGG